MLIRAHDDESSNDVRWRAFLAAQGFGHFAASGSSRDVPVLVPTQFLLDGDLVRFHLAAQNPVLECLRENPKAVLSAAGDWAYIPGSWKQIGDEDPRVGIPTTYYGAVQLTGEAAVIDEPAHIAQILQAQLGDLEPGSDYVDPIEHGAKLRTIRGIEMRVTDVRAKFKYGGNVDTEHRAAVADKLAQRQGPGDAAARRHIPAD